MLRLSITLGCICAVTFFGCAYYNGLYNANQLVKGALRAERQGRIGEARSLWSRAAVKAESVAVRYPDSKYRDDALVLQGRALRAAGQCRSAVEPLREVVATSQDGELLEQAYFFIGRCQYEDGAVDSAVASLARSLPSDDTLLASAAHLWRGRALAAQGQDDAAIVDFSASSLVDAAFDLALAYARIGRIAESERVMKWRVDGDYSEAKWLSTLDSVGEHAPELSAAIVELLLEHPDISAEQRGRLLLQDGDRWGSVGKSADASARYRQVLSVVPNTSVGTAAHFRLLLADMRSNADLARLPHWADSLAALDEVPASLQSQLSQVATAVEMAAMSLERDEERHAAGDWGARNPDLEMFLAAEALRDRVGADSLATAMFLEVSRRFPRSAVAPKALLAAADLNPEARDELVAVVRSEYPRSPYALVLGGLADDAYAALEDSLRTLILARGGAI